MRKWLFDHLSELLMQGAILLREVGVVRYWGIGVLRYWVIKGMQEPETGIQYTTSQYPNTSIPQNPNTPIPQYLNTPIPQYPNTILEQKKGGTLEKAPRIMTLKLTNCC